MVPAQYNGGYLVTNFVANKYFSFIPRVVAGLIFSQRIFFIFFIVAFLFRNFYDICINLNHKPLVKQK